MTKTFPSLAAGKLARFWLWPMLVFVLVAGSVGGIWWWSARTRRAALEQEAQVAADQLAVHLGRWFADRLQVVEHVAQNWSPELVAEPSNFQSFAGDLFDLFEGMQALNWIDADWKIAIIVPEQGNRRALGADLHVHPEPDVAAALARAEKTTLIVRTSGIRLLQGMQGLATYRRVVYAQGNTAGFVNGVFAVGKMVAKCLSESLPRSSFRMAVFDGDQLLYSSAPSSDWHDWPYLQRRRVMVADKPFLALLAPSPAKIASGRGPGDILFPLLGLALALVLAWLVRVELSRRQRLIDSENRYRALFVMAGDAIFLMQGDTFVDCNSKALEIFACRREDLVGSTPYRFSPPRQADGRDSQEAARARIEQAHREGLITFEWRHQTLAGEPFECEVTLNGVEISGQRYLLASVRDITARKEAERQRLEFEQRLLQSQKLESLGVMAGGIAHDFNNLLAVMLGNVDLILTDLPAESLLRRGLQEVRQAAQRAAELTNQMLAYAGKGQLMVEGVDLNLLVNNSLRLLQASISKKAELKLELARELPPVLGDRVQLRQVLINLVSNASEALEERRGFISIRTALEKNSVHSGENGAQVLLEVADTGCGMDEQVRQRIFDPFFTTKFAGRGLGMAAVQGIVRGHQGKIEIATTRGRGTTVRVYFPAADRKSTADTGETAPAAIDDKLRATVLLVDDESFVRQVGRKMLERLGCQVVTADDGEQAVEIFRARRDELDLVLLDMTMPRLSGTEVFAQMREVDERVPVVMCSGFTEADAAERLQEHAPAAFLQKPFDMWKLKTVLEQVLSYRASESGSGTTNQD